MKIFVFSLLPLLASFAGAAYVAVPPKDVVALEGSNVTLECQTVIQDHETEYLEWKEYITSPSGLIIFHSFEDDNIHKPEKYEIHGEYDLIVKSVKVEDGGMYSCKLSFSETSANNADLIVVGKPELILPNKIVGGKNTTIVCKVRFGSRRPDDLAPEEVPDIRILYNEMEVPGEKSLTEGKPGDPDTPASMAYEPSIIYYRANVTVQSKHDEDNLTCEVYTEDPEFSTTVEKTLNVLYGTNTVSLGPIWPLPETYEVGDVITCDANGNPTPTVKWSVPKAPSTKAVTGLSNLTITEDMVGEPQEWVCTAMNYVDGETYTAAKNITFTVSEPKDPSGGGGAETIGVSLAAVILPVAFASFFH